MRLGLLALSTIGLLLGGAVCLPLADDSRSIPAGTVFGVSVNEPNGDRSVTLGTIVRVEWAITNQTDAEAAVTIFVVNRADRARTELASQTIAANTTTTRAVDWDTTAFASGEYSVMVEAVAGDERAEASGAGRVTIAAPPTLEFTAPTADATLEQGETVTISWNADDADGEADLTISIDTDTDHSNGNEIAILRDQSVGSDLSGDSLTVGSDSSDDSLTVGSDSSGDSLDWDGTDADGAAVAAGTYNIFGVIDDGVNAPVTAEGLASITTPNAPPALTFDEPAAAVTVDRGETTTLSWTPVDAEGDDLFVTILFDNDDQQDETAGDEIPAVVLVERHLDDEDSRTFEWDTTDVEAGDYFLQALIEDGVNDEVFVVHTVGVTIVDADTAPTLEFTEPTDDIDFLASEPVLSFAFTVNDPEDDVFVDLKVDTDDDHANGNENAILLQRLVESGESEEEFGWDGNTWDGQKLPNGIYTVVATIDDGKSPVTVELDALIFRRTEASDPLIALLEPATPQIVDPGDFVTIHWRDDTPTDGATIELLIDDDNQTDELSEVGDPALRILADRDAGTDGILDSFRWQVPALDPGTYFIFAKIKNEDDDDEHVSVAQGTIIVRDPANP